MNYGLDTFRKSDEFLSESFLSSMNDPNNSSAKGNCSNLNDSMRDTSNILGDTYEAESDVTYTKQINREAEKKREQRQKRNYGEKKFNSVSSNVYIKESLESADSVGRNSYKLGM